MNDQPAPLLQVSDLSIRFGELTAVDRISFQIGKGETVAVVGESGSGKSVTALALTRLLPPAPACQVTGQIQFRGQNLAALDDQGLRRIRGKEIAYIFQEPSASLNPVFTIGAQIAEAIRLHRPDVSDPAVEIIRVLDLVGIRDPEKRFRSYPHQLSGGMQQRAMIAMALVCQPAILVADEPTTALDVTIQAQIIDLLRELKAKLGMSILMITHNFGIVHGFADRVLVMFRGKIVEEGPTEQVLRHPRHPYTQALIGCIPRLGQKKQRLTTIDYSQIT
ncbi:MAG: peptide transporter ATP-binding protein [Verrucomicrobiota bacterium]